MKLLVSLVSIVALLFFAVPALAQSVSPFSGNLDRPTSTWDAEDAEDEMNPDPPPDEEDEEDPEDDDEEGDDPEFMDEELEGNQIVLCLDASGSMSIGYDPGYPVYNSSGGIISYPDRWETVQSEAANAINAMTDEHLFDVVIYDTYVAACFGPGLVEATSGNKSQAISWIYAKHTTGCTNSYDALMHAFNDYGTDLDIIMFMSDGMPNTALSLGHGACSWYSGSQSDILNAIGPWSQAQQNPNFVFKVIQVGGSVMPFMQQLAGAANGGSFVLK